MGTASPTFNLISSENVEGMNVYDLSGNKIGTVDHLMIDKVSGNVRYAVMGFGGVLGLGHSHYPRPWNAIKYDTNYDGFITYVTGDQLKDAPEFSDDSWTEDWETRWHQHSQTKPYWDEQGDRQSQSQMSPPSERM